MAVLEAILAVVGLLMLVLLAYCFLAESKPDAPAEEDLAAPYREGLHAALRLQATAHDLQQQMYAEAIRRAEAEADPSTATPYREGNSSCTTTTSSSKRRSSA
jgi:hypothetical protein